jgi:hypothetical protein
MHKSATKCNATVGKWCKNKHRASKIIDTLETYQEARKRVGIGLPGWLPPLKETFVGSLGTWVQPGTLVLTWHWVIV